MKFSQLRRLGWDTETTSANPLEARIITAAIVVRGGGLEDRTFSYVINPGVPIPPETTEIHGLDDQAVQERGADPKKALDEIAGQLAAALNYLMPVAAFNQSYDWTVLNCDLERHGLPSMYQRIDGEPYSLLDPHVIERQCTPRVRGKGARKLKPTCERYGVSLEDWHTAEADALAALKLTDALFSYFPHLEGMGPRQLFAAQKAWRAEQQAGLQEFLRQENPRAVCAPEWPLLERPSRGEGQ